MATSLANSNSNATSNSSITDDATTAASNLLLQQQPPVIAIDDDDDDDDEESIDEDQLTEFKEQLISLGSFPVRSLQWSGVQCSAVWTM